MELENLFSPGKIGNVELKNRIIRSATWTGAATENGYITDKLIAIYNKVAEGGTGLIISGYIGIEAAGAATPYMACWFDDSYTSGQKRLVKSVHEYTDVKIAAQIAHTGSNLMKPNYEPIGPSPIWNRWLKKNCRELTIEEIERIINRFVDVGCKAYESEYDLLQLHGAHGYLLSDFVSPFTNKRTDKYGGTIEKRTKILVDIYNQLRDRVGKEFPIFIKLNSRDFCEGGLTLKEAQRIAKILIDTGYDAIEPSLGRVDIEFIRKKNFSTVNIKTEEQRNYFLPNVKALKPVMNGRPIILMGGVRNPITSESIIKENIADFIAMSRPLIREPDLPNRWKSGDLNPAKCISCDGCGKTAWKGDLHCVQKERLEKD
ncbi:MAG: NADH:flavin oxidoreductase [Promethearchaeota archaeon]